MIGLRFIAGGYHAIKIEKDEYVKELLPQFPPKAFM